MFFEESFDREFDEISFYVKNASFIVMSFIVA